MMERGPETFIAQVQSLVELRELRDRARKVLPEANLNRFFEDHIAEALAHVVAQAKEYNEKAAKAAAAELEKHRKAHQAKKEAAQ